MEASSSSPYFGYLVLLAVVVAALVYLIQQAQANASSERVIVTAEFASFQRNYCRAFLCALAPRELARRRCRLAACIPLGRCTCGRPPQAGLPTCGLQVQGDDALLLHEQLLRFAGASLGDQREQRELLLRGPLRRTSIRTVRHVAMHNRHVGVLRMFFVFGCWNVALLGNL